MNDLKQQLKQVGMMHHAQQIMLRVIKAGTFPQSVCADVARSVNYLDELNILTTKQLDILKEAIKNAPKEAPAEPESPVVAAVDAPKVD